MNNKNGAIPWTLATFVILWALVTFILSATLGMVTANAKKTREKDRAEVARFENSARAYKNALQLVVNSVTLAHQDDPELNIKWYGIAPIESGRTNIGLIWRAMMQSIDWTNRSTTVRIPPGIYNCSDTAFELY